MEADEGLSSATLPGLVVVICPLAPRTPNKYDPFGRSTYKSSSSGTIIYVYDALNRLSKKQYPDSMEVDYVYDLVNKIQSVNDPTGTYGFSYDNMNRLTGTTTNYSFLARNITTSISYDKASNRAVHHLRGSIARVGLDNRRLFVRSVLSLFL